MTRPPTLVSPSEVNGHLPSTIVVNGSTESDPHRPMSRVVPVRVLDGKTGKIGTRIEKLGSRRMPWPIWTLYRIGSSGRGGSQTRLRWATPLVPCGIINWVYSKAGYPKILGSLVDIVVESCRSVVIK